jgi:hypothetical protein
LENLEVVFLLDDLTASRFVIEPFPLFLARVSLGSALSEKLLQGITSWLLRSHDQFAALDCQADLPQIGCVHRHPFKSLLKNVEPHMWHYMCGTDT